MFDISWSIRLIFGWRIISPLYPAIIFQNALFYIDCNKTKCLSFCNPRSEIKTYCFRYWMKLSPCEEGTLASLEETLKISMITSKKSNNIFLFHFVSLLLHKFCTLIHTPRLIWTHILENKRNLITTMYIPTCKSRT